MYVPSDRASRIFVLSHNFLYAESHTKAVVLNHKLYDEMLKKNIIKTNLDLIPMLYNSEISHTTIKQVEEHYSQLLVKNLTS
jgi:hypothetical protein